MNHCASYEPLLDAFTEGDLFLEDMVWVQQHLNTCPECQAYVDDLLAIRAAFPTVEDTEVPADFAANVMAAIAANPRVAVNETPVKSTKRKAPWVKMLAPLAACCAIVILAQTGLGGGGSSKESAAPAAEAPMEMQMTADSAVAEEDVLEYSAATEAQPESEIMEDMGVGRTENTAAEAAPKAKDALYSIVITVDADYIGDLLDGYTPIHDGETLEYELSKAEYNDLLAKLADRDELPAEESFDSDSERVLVIVRQ